MTPREVVLVGAGVLALAGALGCVASTRSPLGAVVGLVVALGGVSLACVVAGAPWVAALQLLVAAGMGLALLLGGIDRVGTGRAAIPPPTTRRIALRAVAAVLALAAFGWVLRGGALRWGVTAPAVGADDPRAVGVALFGGEPVVVAAVGLVLLTAVVAGAALAARTRS